MSTENVHLLHLGLAEQGKIHALKNEHKEALKHYREAIKIAVSLKAPEVFFRHYTQCVVESLEKLGNYDEAIQFYQAAHEHYTAQHVSSNLHNKDHADILQKLGCTLLKKGATEEAKNAFNLAIKIAGEADISLSKELLGWLQRGYSVNLTRIEQLQIKHHYFVVRQGQVNEKICSITVSRGRMPV
ncbi:MAG: tetratricopeptide repeat protein [Nitrincola sp.]|nr:tetratricopeptide repeat protein [Nitrincola sp.]